MSEYLSAAELAQLNIPSLPKTPKGISDKAKREYWPSRRRAQRGGGNPEPLYRQLEQRRLLPQQPYLEGSAELADSVRTLAHTLQKQAQALINLRPPLVQKVVPQDSSLHLLAFLWYGDHSRQAELLRLNPGIVHPNFIARGTVLNAYAQ